MVFTIRYDFNNFPRHISNDFLKNLLKLMIVSKMNTRFKPDVVNYFKELINQINNCEIHVVRYGQPLLYLKYHEIEFTDQKISSYFIRRNDFIIDVFIESIDKEHIKLFDLFISNPSYKVLWNTSVNYDKSLFQLFDYFIDSINNLTLLESTNSNTLKEKKFGIRNVNITKNSSFIEFLIDENLIIMELNQRKKIKNRCSIVFGHSNISNALFSSINNFR